MAPQQEPGTPSPSRMAQGLIAVSLLCVVGVTAWYGRAAWADSGGFALVLFGVPLACSALALWAERASGTVLAPAAVTVLAGIALVWSLVTALGIGLVFLVPALLLVCAAMVSWLHRLDGRSATPTRA